MQPTWVTLNVKKNKNKILRKRMPLLPLAGSETRTLLAPEAPRTPPPLDMTTLVVAHCLALLLYPVTA